GSAPADHVSKVPPLLPAKPATKTETASPLGKPAIAPVPIAANPESVTPAPSAIAARMPHPAVDTKSGQVSTAPLPSASADRVQSPISPDTEAASAAPAPVTPAPLPHADMTRVVPTTSPQGIISREVCNQLPSLGEIAQC